MSSNFYHIAILAGTVDGGPIWGTGCSAHAAQADAAKWLATARAEKWPGYGTSDIDLAVQVLPCTVTVYRAVCDVGGETLPWALVDGVVRLSRKV